MPGGSGRRFVGCALTLLLAAGVVLLAGFPLVPSGPGRAVLRNARRMLERIKLVDGAGSGLDADTVRGLAPMVVRDANGALVGTVAEPATPLSVVRRFQDRLMVFQVLEAGLVTTTCPFLCYESADCTGTPYRDAQDSLLPFVSVCGTTAYFPAGGVTPRPIRSCRVEGVAQCQAQDGSTIAVTELGTSDVSALGLVPPFHVEGP